MKQVGFPFMLLVLLLQTACREKPTVVTPAGRSDLPDTSDCYLNHRALESWLQTYSEFDIPEKKILAFYQGRNYRTAWFNHAGLNEYSGNFINLLNHEEKIYRMEIPRGYPGVDELYRHLAEPVGRGCADSLMVRLEILLTIHFFKYAQRNWEGAGDSVLKHAGWFIERKEINYARLLNDFLSSKSPSGMREPVYSQYSLIKQFLGKYHQLAHNNGWPILDTLFSIEKGEASPDVDSLRKVLFILGDLREFKPGEMFDDTLEAGIRTFQARHGLEINGRPDEPTLKELRVPAEERFRQILINLERGRWVPDDMQGDHVFVNIPQFRMHVYEQDVYQWSCNVIVGKSNSVNQTVIFNDSIEFVVFCPYWNIPKNILTMEVLPALKQDRNYLLKNNMEVVDHSGRPVTADLNWDNYTEHFPYIIRERPGENNSLGRVKFLFPNSFDIYLHDTPARSLFTKTTRAFSHGCIRIESPFRFAQFLLRYDTTWTGERITAAMESGQETFVKLKKKVPVFIAYFTCWVDPEGRLNFRKDVYGHDKKMKHLLFVN